MTKMSIHNYLKKHELFGAALPLGERTPQLIVVIPCYDEPELSVTLESLQRAMCSDVCVEVIVVVNDGECSPKEIVAQNDKSYLDLQHWCKNARFDYPLLPVRLKNIRRKHAGAGYARKVGMDLATWRFLQYDNCDGVIVSLDADTIVAKNYFEALAASFNDKEYQGAIIRFEHRISGGEFSSDIYTAIERYELHLRYLYKGLKYTGFPYVHHTIGSAFAVRAKAYAKHGGMNRKQGGEDFYFLHKLFPHERFVELNETCVYPSSRPSHRVPFGTGPQIRESVKENGLLTYHPEVFELLKAFFCEIPCLYSKNVVFPKVIMDFLTSIDYVQKLEEIRNNASTEKAFVKRFYAFFDAFQLVKFLNYSHQECFVKIPVEEAARWALGHMGGSEGESLLKTYRELEGGF